MQNNKLTNQHREPDRATAGFTLLEALVATALAGFLAMGIVSMMTFAVSAVEVSQEITDLTAVAVDQLEFLNSLPFSDTALQAGGNLQSNDAGYSVDPVNGAPGVYLRWQVTDNTFWLKHIVVMAADSNARGAERQVVIETFRILAQ